MSIAITTDLEQLRTPAKKIEFLDSAGTHHEETDEVVAKLKEAFDENKSVIALSAPQIGIGKRAFGIRFDDGVKFFIDPVITAKANYKIAVETCASMPNKEIIMQRPEEVSIVYYDEKLKYEDNKLLGDAARLFDQQYSILDGDLPDELGLVSDINDDGPRSALTQDEWKEVIEIYKQFAQLRHKAYMEAIEANEIDKAAYKQLKLQEDIINGRIVAVETPKESKATAGGNRTQRRAMSKQIKGQLSKLKQQQNAKKGKK